MKKSRQPYYVILWNKCRSPFIYLPVLLFLMLLYLLEITQLPMYSFHMKSSANHDDGSGCKIPYLDPYDKSILKYVEKVKPFTCGNLPPLVTSNLSFIHLEIDHLPLYNISNVSMLLCYYQPFWRVNPSANIADNVFGFGKSVPFTSSAKIIDEFIKVVCKINSTEIYKDYFFFVPMKDKTNLIEQGNKDEKMNVLIFGLDSMSRLNFQRQLPHMKTILTKKLNAIEYIGFNKVGDNTFPNLIPFLTGLSIDELQQSCWPKLTSKFDNCTFIWQKYSRAGYLTAFAEDSSWMGLFNYLKFGFIKQPTDYYWRTFNYLAEYDIGNNKPYNSVLCIGARLVYTILLQYIEKLVYSLKQQRYFGIFWGTSLSHDNLNYPGQADSHYARFFSKLKTSQMLNDTVLIVLSDHGIRYGGIRTTHMGQLEERLPFLFFILPQWFAQKYPTAVANLKLNSHRLTTYFDLYETLVDLLHVQNLSSDNIRNRSYRMNQRGISLFQIIPKNRTCASANIEAHWCTCQKNVEVDRHNSKVVRVAQFIVAYMNALLKGNQSCALLHLNSILDARLLTSGTIREYTLIIRTDPGDGLFEATVRCVDEKNPLELTGTVSRLNLYGNTSVCVTDFRLKLYCFCL